MKDKVNRLISSTLTTIVLLLIYATGLAAATFIEKYQGTLVAKAMVYYSPVFFLLQFFLVINFIAVLIKHQYVKQRRWGLILTHFAFIIILCGALISHLMGKEGIVHIREGETTNQMAVPSAHSTTYQTLPFSLELVKFNLHRYPGSSSPSSYESELKVYTDSKTYETKVYMNNVLDIQGYRFFQASYDRDEKGTVLSVNKDVWGRNVTYIGYLLLIIGLIASLIGKNSRFRKLNRRMKEVLDLSKGVNILVCLLCFSAGVYAENQEKTVGEIIEKYKVSPQHAVRFGSLPVQSANGRMIPMNTFSSEILRKLHKQDHLGSLNSDQFLLSLLAVPDLWGQVPFIEVSNKELIRHFGLSGKNCAYVEMFDSYGNYKLMELVEKAYNKKPNERNKFDKDLLKLDEKVNIIHQLFSYQLLNIFPKENDPNHKWYAPGDNLSVFVGKDSLFVSHIMEWYLAEVQSGMQSGDWKKADEILDMITTYQSAKNKTLDIDSRKISFELQYNKWKIFSNCKVAYLILGGLLLIVSFLCLSRQTQWKTVAFRILVIGVVVTFCCHMVGMGMRWYIGGYAPWSNSYETMVYVAWATVCAGLLFVRRSAITFALATLFGGIILFVSGLNWMDPQIGTLVPVLKSPWLMFHVAVIVAAYGFFGISFLIGLTNLAMMSLIRKANGKVVLSRIKQLSIVNEMSLIIGLSLMTIGTFLGAVWANESWGRYWGWDPKETWALVTMLIYAIVTHLHIVKRYNNPWTFNLWSVIAFASVLMTFFGVNYFLSGMHSYGENSNIHGLFVYLYGAAGVILLLILTARNGYRKVKTDWTEIEQENKKEINK